MYVSVMTEAEILYGVLRVGAERRRELRDQIDWLLEDLLSVVPISRGVASRFAAVRRELELAGTPMSASDMWIGATALDAGLTLVTSDTAFSRIADLELEDWLVEA